MIKNSIANAKIPCNASPPLIKGHVGSTVAILFVMNRALPQPLVQYRDVAIKAI